MVKYSISGMVICVVFSGRCIMFLFLRLNIVMMVNNRVVRVIGLILGRKIF